MKNWKQFAFTTILAIFGIIGVTACADAEKNFMTKPFDDGKSIEITSIGDYAFAGNQ